VQLALYEMGGSLSAHGFISSNAWEAFRIVASSSNLPTICSATGSPSEVNPQGTDAAGWWVKLKICVFSRAT
jgi:hypothetical protein